MADVIITGKSGRDYFFNAHHIETDNPECWPTGIHYYANLFKQFGIHEWRLADQENAAYKLCLEYDPNFKTNDIIEDLTEDGSFRLIAKTLKGKTGL